MALHLLRAALVQRSATLGVAAPSPTVVYFKPAAADFPEVVDFMRRCASQYSLAVRELGSFKEGLATLVSEGTRAVIMGTRASDPDGASLDGHFTPTSVGWPALLRVCPLLRWRYEDVWAFLRGASLDYCPLYDEGYSSLGSVGDSLQNPLLRRTNGTDGYLPAWQLADGAYERMGRVGALSPKLVPPAAALRCCGGHCCCCCRVGTAGGTGRAAGEMCQCGAHCSPK